MALVNGFFFFALYGHEEILKKTFSETTGKILK